MKKQFFELMQIGDGWQAFFAFQVFHRQAKDWINMRWGFNAGALLEEALDRYKLFIESQTPSEAEFNTGTQQDRKLALRGINLPGVGLQMGLLGKVNAQNKEKAQQAAQSFAREIYSSFPHDFILVPAELSNDYDRLAGRDILIANSNLAQIQRRIAFVPLAHGYKYFSGLWQASSHSNEQIWRSLSAMPNQVLFNVLIQPAIYYDGERQSLLDLKKDISNKEHITELTSAYIPWAEKFIDRRVAAWKKFFLLQIHIVADGNLDENLLRSIGSALTYDEKDLQHPGFQIKWPESDALIQSWREDILTMNFVPSQRVEDLVDSDEAFAVLRLPYLPEAGLPGANFIEFKKEPDPAQKEQKS
jgi:hypothetical protein